MEEDIITEFLKAHAKDSPTIFIDGFEQCPVCGMRPEKMKKLARAIEELKEKAWRYDDLCK